MHVQFLLRMNTWFFETCRENIELKLSCKKYAFSSVLITHYL